jgi:hypothetical protein
MSKFSNKNKSGSISERSLDRKSNVRDERRVNEDLLKIVFSFKDFDVRQIPPGQSYDDWQKKELLAYMIEKFGEICKYNILEARQKGMITIYEKFPENSDFQYPRIVKRDKSINWAVITNIKGQKARVAGHIIENVFYVVFLDKEHCFYPSELKHT